MARNTWTQYNAIISKPMPTCDGNAVIFNFGSECTQITTDTADSEIIASDDMCINPDGQYVAAVYRAYPGKISGRLLFSSTLTHIPQIFRPGESCPGQGRTPNFCF